MKILVIEAQKQLATSIRNLLEAHGFEVEIFHKELAKYSHTVFDKYDLIIADTSNPFLFNYQSLKSIRHNHTVPILLLTEKTNAEDRIDGLNAGADFYLEKPFDMRELLASVHALLRRTSSHDYLSFGNTTLHLAAGTLHCGEKAIRLSLKELDIMRLLLRNPDHNISKNMILSFAWDYDSNAIDNNVEVYVSFLRKKLSVIHSNIKIVAIRKLGYHLEIDTNK